MKYLLLLLLTLRLHADNLLDFSAGRRVPFSTQYFVNTWQWDASASPELLHVYDASDVLQTPFEEANSDVHSSWSAAWLVQPRADGVKVGVIDRNLHGAQVASVIGASSGELRGGAIGAELLLTPSSYNSTQVSAQIAQLAADGASIVNMSFGYTGRRPDDVIAAMTAAPNVLFVLAALNVVNQPPNEDTSTDWLCLADLPNAICVTAYAKGDIIFGGYGQTVDVAAAGRRVPVDDYSFVFGPIPASSLGSEENIGEDRAGLWSVTGTSLAAPRVAAAAALIKARHPNETPPQIIERICVSANTSPYWDVNTRCGMLNVERALTYCRTYTLGITKSAETVPWGTIQVSAAVVHVGGPPGGTAIVQSASTVTGPWTDDFAVTTSGWPEPHFVGNNGTQKFFKFKVD